MPKPTSIELFAGCGGLALGLHRAGFDGLFAIERDPMAYETLSANLVRKDAPYHAFRRWPKWVPQTNIDLVEFLGNDLHRERLVALRGSVDIVAGGPPCQGFSVGGKRDGDDDRNVLVYRMLDFVDLVQPRVVLIENVEGIARRFVSKPGVATRSVAEDAIDRLADMGYVASYHVVNAVDFGVPQARRRVAIIGVRNPGINQATLHELVASTLTKAARLTREKHGLPLTGSISVRDAISDLAGSDTVPTPDSPGFVSGLYEAATSAYARLMREGVDDASIPDSHRFSKHGVGVTTLYELAHRTQAPGRLTKGFLLENGTKKDKKVLVDADQPVSTITTHPDEYIHYQYPRNVTVREMARLQSFPDAFHFKGRYTINGPRRRFDVARCSQVGNAVPPLLGEGLGRAILIVLDALEAKRRPKVASAGRKMVHA